MIKSPMHNYFSKIAHAKRWENSIGIGQAGSITCLFIIGSMVKNIPYQNTCQKAGRQSK
jgi:hypothetical protein